MRAGVRAALIVAALCRWGVIPAAAEPFRDGPVEAELVSDREAVAPGERFWVALRLRADPKWHTYWKDPGKAGLATSVRWELPQGFAAGPLRWPAPERFEHPAGEQLGYAGEVWLISQVAAPRSMAEGALELKASAQWLACHEDGECAAGAADLALGLEAGSPRGSARREELLARLAAAPSEEGAPSGAGAAALAELCLMALLGGLVLNLMPCVLPVLSIKALGLGLEGARAPSAARALGHLLGVWASLWSFAAVLLALRAGGGTLGWGFHMQEPACVLALASLFWLLALNLLGVFELWGLPGARPGSGAAGPFTGAFLGGALSAWVAAPCTGPFLGAALGLSLGQTAPAALAIFTALGLGMALPTCLLCLCPALTAWLPRPGPWMLGLKRALALPLLGTALWLGWVLHAQAGLAALRALSLALGGVGAAAWVYGRAGDPRKSPARRGLEAGLAAGLAAALLSLAVEALPRGSAALRAGGLEADVVAYSPQRLQEYRNAGVPVLVEFTAAWCLTCQVNERLALAAPPVRRRLKERGVVLMRADWTTRDPEIARALRALGRASVPAYALYGRAAESPSLLPTLLSPAILVGALERHT